MPGVHVDGMDVMKVRAGVAGVGGCDILCSSKLPLRCHSAVCIELLHATCLPLVSMACKLPCPILDPPPPPPPPLAS